jgi:hypothetical protein
MYSAVNLYVTYLHRALKRQRQPRKWSELLSSSKRFSFFLGGGDFETVSTCFPRLAKSSESHIQIIARFYTYIHTYIHTNIHTYIHTFVCVQAQRWKNWDCFEKDSSPLLTTCKCKKFQFTQSGDHNYFIKWGKVMYTVTVLPSPNSWLRDVAQ